jgi:hypothetical protein
MMNPIMLMYVTKDSLKNYWGKGAQLWYLVETQRAEGGVNRAESE